MPQVDKVNRLNRDTVDYATLMPSNTVDWPLLGMVQGCCALDSDPIRRES